MKKILFIFVLTAFVLSACVTPPTPTPIFPVSEMSNPALATTDLKITVKDDKVEAIFYLKDIPSELAFQRDGVNKNEQEYIWEICVDVDNDKKTGMTSGFFSIGADYCISAISFKFSDTPITEPIEQGVQVNVWELSDSGGKSLDKGTIEVDTEANTIKFSGKISGITDTSQFYYRTFDINPGGSPETNSGTLFGQVIIEK